jgi:hypothetical protein
MGLSHTGAESTFMWPGFDPQIRRELALVREMVALRHSTPSREWPLVFLPDRGELLVVREWPNGALTAYMNSIPSDSPDQ